MMMIKEKKILKGSILVFFVFALAILNFNLFFSQKNLNNLKINNIYSDWQIIDVQSSESSYLLWAKDQNGKDHVYTWGLDAYGLLANGKASSNVLEDAKYYQPAEIHYSDSGTPDDLTDDLTTIPDYIEIQQISVGGKNTMALVENTNSGQQELYAWGYSAQGALGVPRAGGYVPYELLFPTKIELQNNSGDLPEDLQIQDISAGNGISVISGTDANDNNYIFTAGKDDNGGLGRDTNTTTPDYLFYQIEYTDDILSNDDSYQVEEVYGSNINYGGGGSYILISDSGTGANHLYGVGSNYSGVLLADSQDGNGNYDTYKEVTYPEEMKDVDGNVEIKSFSTSVTPDISGEFNHSYTFYNQLVFVDPESNQDYLYTWGYNLYGNVGNGTTSGSGSSNLVFDHMYNVVFPQGNNYTIEQSEGSYFSSDAILRDSQGLEHAYYWGDTRNVGLSTREEETGIISEPIEIDYSPQFDQSTASITKMGFSRNNGFMLTETGSDEDLIQQLYFWGDNIRGQVTGDETDTNEIVYQPTELFSTFSLSDPVLTFAADYVEFSFKLAGTTNIIQPSSVYAKDLSSNQLIFPIDISSTTKGNYTFYQIRFKNLSPENQYQFHIGYTNDYFGFSQEDILIDNYSTVISNNIWFIVLISVLSLLILIMIIIIYQLESKKKED